MKRLYLTKEQENFVVLALESYIRALKEEKEKQKHIGGGCVSNLVEGSLQQGEMVIAALKAQEKKCPKCSGTGDIHQNCILR